MLSIKNLFNKKYISKWIVFLAIISIPIFGNQATQTAYFDALSSAYIGVSVFVALTLLIFYGLEYWLKIDTAAFLEKHKKYHIPIAAFLGVLPGCGGAIMVITQYTLGRLGFGAVIAVLTATMGDAAFLLLAQKPDKAFLVFAISFITAIIFGYLVEKIHGYDYLKPEVKELPSTHQYISYGWVKLPWLIALIPGLVIGILGLMQLEPLTNTFFENLGINNFNLTIGVTGALLSLFLWFINPDAGTNQSNGLKCRNNDDLLEKVTADTSFVTTWVIIGFLLFEMTVLWTGFDLEGLFQSAKPLLPLIAVAIGSLPGCGPQVVVTTLYLQGLVPFSSQLANAISNDGDALFPAMTIAPKASLMATLYTSIPALVISYIYYFFFER